MFAGDTLTWPLDGAQLEAIRGDADVLAWTAWTREAVGHAELVRVDASLSRLARVGIAPAHRGRGLGRQLVEAVLAEAAGRAIRAVDLNVYEHNGPAIRLYRSLGFEPQPSVAADPSVLRMTKHLG